MFYLFLIVVAADVIFAFLPSAYLSEHPYLGQIYLAIVVAQGLWLIAQFCMLIWALRWFLVRNAIAVGMCLIGPFGLFVSRFPTAAADDDGTLLSVPHILMYLGWSAWLMIAWGSLWLISAALVEGPGMFTRELNAAPRPSSRYRLRRRGPLWIVDDVDRGNGS